MSSLLFLIAQLSASQALPISETSQNLDNYRSSAESHLFLRTDNSTEFAPAWVPEPSTRGTFRLLYSCLFTLTLCVYTAIHLNVPKRRESGLELFWRKLKWVLVAIFAPELVLYAAYVQWHVASVTCSDLNKLAEKHKYQGDEFVDDEDSSPWDEVKTKNMQPKYKRFSLLYGYYIVMGGLVMDVRDLHDEYTRVTVTPEGLLHLASMGHFVDISDETIKDKSKSDAFAKIIVMLQVTWMIVQTCSRLAAGLPVTIIEGHTLVHVVTALAMYTLWFKKPLNISESTVISHGGFVDEAALMLVRCTNLGGKATSPTAGLARNRRSSGVLPIWKRMVIWLVRLVGLMDDANEIKEKWLGLERLTLDPDDTSESAYLSNCLSAVPEVKEAKKKTVLQRRGTQSVNQESTRPGLAHEGEGLLKTPEIGEGTARPGTTPSPKEVDKPVIIDQTPDSDTSNQPLKYEILLPDEQRKIAVIRSGQYLSCGIGPDRHWHVLSIELSSKTVRRWESAARALGKDHLGVESKRCYFIEGQPSNLPIPNEQGLDSSGNINVFWILLIFFFLCTGYGCVHCVAWNSAFPTQIEMIFWRFACIDLAVAGLVYFILFAFYTAAGEGYKSHYSASEKMIIVIAVLHFVVYLAARVFLVVEAFLSVRHLKAGAYDMVDWSAFIPHI